MKPSDETYVQAEADAGAGATPLADVQPQLQSAANSTLRRDQCTTGTGLSLTDASTQAAELPVPRTERALGAHTVGAAPATELQAVSPPADEPDIANSDFLSLSSDAPSIELPAKALEQHAAQATSGPAPDAVVSNTAMSQPEAQEPDTLAVATSPDAGTVAPASSGQGSAEEPLTVIRPDPSASSMLRAQALASNEALLTGCGGQGHEEHADEDSFLSTPRSSTSQAEALDIAQARDAGCVDSKAQYLTTGMLDRSAAAQAGQAAAATTPAPRSKQSILFKTLPGSRQDVIERQISLIVGACLPGTQPPGQAALRRQQLLGPSAQLVKLLGG